MLAPSGVPQRSLLTPYLFALFIFTPNINAPNARSVKYTDDLTLVESCSNLARSPTLLHDIENWASENKLALNPKKRQQMITYRSKKLENQQFVSSE